MAASLVLIAASARAGFFDAQLELASDRLFRGLSQNNGLSYAAGADYGFDNRVYLGARAGNNRSAGNAEFDAYAGYTRALVFRDLLPYTVDAGLSASLYTGDRSGPRAQNLDYAEAYAGVTAGPASFRAFYSPDYYNLGAPGYRFNASLKYPLRPSLSVTGALAWNDGGGVRRLIAERTENRRGRAYLDYSLTLQQRLPRDFAVTLQAAGTSVDVDGQRLPRVVLGLRKNF